MLFIDTLKLKSVQTVVHMSKRLIEKFKMVELKNCENLAQYDMAGISFWIYLQASIWTCFEWDTLSFSYLPLSLTICVAYITSTVGAHTFCSCFPATFAGKQ